MIAKILHKTSGEIRNTDIDTVSISTPSIVELPIAPESVRSFVRDGQHLKITLLNGKVVVLENFFVKSDAGERSDLVLEDQAGVRWWGQYPEQWDEFHFTEIETNVFAAAP